MLMYVIPTPRIIYALRNKERFFLLRIEVMNSLNIDIICETYLSNTYVQLEVLLLSTYFFYRS